MEKERTERKNSKKIKITKSAVKEFMTDILWIVVGSFIGAVAVVGIMEPNGLSAGGIVGIIRMLQKFVSLNFSTMYYIAAAIVLVILFFTPCGDFLRSSAGHQYRRHLVERIYVSGNRWTGKGDQKKAAASHFAKQDHVCNGCGRDNCLGICI